MKLRGSVPSLATAVVVSFAVAPVPAADVGKIDGKPVRVDITESSFLNYHFDNRNDRARDVETRLDDNYGEWLNRFNVVASWWDFTAGLRLDTATYFRRPSLSRVPNDPNSQKIGENYLAYHYRDRYLVDPALPSKFYVTYAKPWLELTLGDSYVSFGRGIVLVMRKLDELASDTSLQGAKVTARVKPVAVTLVAGLSNPVRIDEATATSLRDDAPTPDTPYFSSWSRDLIVGARAETKIDAATLGLHAAQIHRRATLDNINSDPPASARDVQTAGLSFAVPSVSESVPLNVYAELALQNRVLATDPAAGEPTEKNHGYAAYLSMSMTSGAVTGSFEGKHYRGYYPAKLNMHPRFIAFTSIQYMAPPTAELVTQDSLSDNSCTTGGRLRVDVKATKAYLWFASLGYFQNWGEITTNICGIGPGLSWTSTGSDAVRSDIIDAYTGFELRSSSDSSYALFTVGSRRDQRADNGALHYREGWLQFDFVKTLDQLWSIELNGWHRGRGNETDAWHEGETYFGVKYTSKRSIFLGHEYTTQQSQVKSGAFLVSGTMQHFLNLGMQFKFSDAVMLRLFVGQQRAALKCVSGVCRQFPSFEGAKSELVLRY